MGRWTNENAYDRQVDTAVAALVWPITREQAVAFVKGVLASESAFNPRAVRGEAHLADASHGLMQMLYSTAQALGYTGAKPTEADRQALRGLYDPATNITLGTRYLHRLVSRYGGDIERAASAYNGGDRPQIALGTRATKAGRICLEWKPTAPTTGRTIDRDCARAYSYKVGEFGNQPYVSKVLHNYNYFFASAAGSPPPPYPKTA
jgi:soluble lytic murein transglycosylase-like protein